MEREIVENDRYFMTQCRELYLTRKGNYLMEKAIVEKER
jgi:hypothetical protein